MEAIELLQARNTISRHKQRLQQELVFVMLVEHMAYDKQVEVHWAGEDKAWHTLQAVYDGPGNANHELWRAQAIFHPSDDASLPGDIEFALRYRTQGKEFWDNNHSRNYFSNADSGVLLGQNARVANAVFTPHLPPGQRH